MTPLLRGDDDSPHAALAIAERAGLIGIAVGCVLTLLTAAAGIHFYAVELDEAWLLFALQGFFRPPPPDIDARLVLTSAGAYALIHASITWLAAGELWLHRVVSWLCVSIALLATLRTGLRETGSRAAALLCCGALAATPGIAMLGSLAFAESLALLLLLGFVAVWSDAATRARRVVLGGALLGLACATRSAVLPAVPALMLFWLLRPDRSAARLIDTLATGTLAVAVFVACQALYVAPFPGPMPSLEYFLNVTGAEGATRFDWTGPLNRLVLAGRLAPLGLAAAVLVGSFAQAQRANAPFRAKPLLLACLGLGQLALWVLLSPKPHLRYAWPGLPAIWIALGMVAADLFVRAQRDHSLVLRTMLVAVLAGSLASELAAGVRDVAYGESTLIAAEHAGMGGLASFNAFEAARDQRAAARFLIEHVAEGERVLVLHLPFELAYLTGLRVTRDAGIPEAPPAWLVLTPIVGERMQLNRATQDWVERDCVLRARFGHYSIYRVLRGAPPAARRADDLPAHPL